MISLSIEALIEAFPHYSVAVVVAENLSVVPERGPDMNAMIESAEAAAQRDYDPENLGSLDVISDWRRAYRDFGIKQTKYRSSVERLLRSAVKGRGLPQISRPVDAYNLISLKYLAPVGADDLNRVTGDLSFRFADGTESFLPLGKADQGEDPPKLGEVVYTDAHKVLCRRWNWYQDARSAIQADTTRAVLTIQSLGHVELGTAAEELCQLLADHCGADCTYRIADSANPVVGF